MTTKTKYTFEHTEQGPNGHHKQTAVVRARTREGAEEKLAQELGKKSLPTEWRLVKFEL